MKLYERFGDRGFHTSVVTTFGIDFDAYENVALARLRGAGCHNNLLVADGRMLTDALDGGSSLPRHAGRLYSATGALAPGVFHSKVLFQAGRVEARLVLSSANMTSSGLAGNLELAGIVTCTAKSGGERAIVAAGWRYLMRLLDGGQQSIGHQLDWMARRSGWLLDATPADGLVTLADGTGAAFIASGVDTGIGLRYIDLIHHPVKRLVVLSPYWDEELDALASLVERLNPEETIAFIDAGKALFPGDRADRIQGLRLLDLEAFAKKRFVHAKAIIAQTKDADHVLFGSANCTVAALGTPTFRGSNEEACLYRRLPPGAAVEALALTPLLSETPLSASTLVQMKLDQTLQLEQIALRSPGRFECVYETLTWWPPASMADSATFPELLDATGEPIGFQLERLGSRGGAIRYHISGPAVRPAFARVNIGEGYSALAIVTLVDALRETAREARGKRAEAAAAQLNGEASEGLWLLEVIDELEAADAKQNGGEPLSRTRPLQYDGSAGEPEKFDKLDYEHFVAGRRSVAAETAVTRNSLAGTDLSLVRGFLNRILAIGEQASTAGPDETDLSGAFDLGDEVRDAEAAIEGGADFEPLKVSVQEAGVDTERRLAGQRRANRDQIVQAAEVFGTRVSTRAENGTLASFDILRLRAILTIIAASGWDDSGERKSLKKLSALQVLPAAGDRHSWPRLLGRILFCFFGGNKPAIRRLAVETVHDQIPHDFIECWATCIWAAHSALVAAKSHKELRGLIASLSLMTEQIYRLTGLNEHELLSAHFLAVMEGLNRRFSERLGLDGSAVANAHIQMTRRILEKAA